MSAEHPWDILGLDGPTDDRRTVRRAYAKQLKSLDQEAEAERFQALRLAYELADQITAYRAGTGRPNARAGGGEPPSPDVQRQPPLSEIAAQAMDGDAAERLLAQLHDEESSMESRLRLVLSDPLLADPLTHDRVERALLRHLDGLMGDLPDHAHLPLSISPRAVAMIDAEFAWLSDFTGFKRRFARYERVAIALAFIESPDRSSTMPIARPTSHWRWLANMAIFIALTLAAAGALTANQVTVSSGAVFLIAFAGTCLADRYLLPQDL
ncbi:MAG: hypothetical protein AAGA32_21020 [Pseudomonadota bacterium]